MVASRSTHRHALTWSICDLGHTHKIAVRISSYLLPHLCLLRHCKRPGDVGWPMHSKCGAFTAHSVQEKHHSSAGNHTSVQHSRAQQKQLVSGEADHHRAAITDSASSVLWTHGFHEVSPWSLFLLPSWRLYISAEQRLFEHLILLMWWLPAWTIIVALT